MCVAALLAGASISAACAQEATPTDAPSDAVSAAVASPQIGLVKTSALDDSNGDGFAQIGEGITFTYTLTNGGPLPLEDITLSETGFSGTGTAPSPTLEEGDSNNDSVLQQIGRAHV